MEENKNVPRIRFPEFTGNWEQRKVSEITAFHKQGFYTTESYDDRKKYYLLRGTDLTENRLLLKDTPKIDATEKDYQAFKTQIGDFLIVRSGTVGTYGIVYDDIPAIFGSYLIDFRFDKTQVTNEFFGYFYQSDSFKNQLKQIIQQSANTNINAENIKSTNIMLPSLEEQRRIGEFLTKIDETVTLQQRKIDEIKEYKKGMLQKMFPKDGERVPEIRFPGFTEPWEQRKLEDILTPNNKVPVTTSAYKRITIGLHLKGLSFSENTRTMADKRPFYVRKKGEIIVGKQNYFNGSIAIVTEEYHNTICSNAIMSFMPCGNVDTNMLFYAISNEDYLRQREYMANGTGQKELSEKDFLDFCVLMPSFEEQRQIGGFINRIDTLITLQQRKIDEMKEYKKGLLQQMFV